ncbi:MAG TPA: hypothetical protein VGO47_13430 [Chlamydiales bacterium]|nr:hypothetical protein [Chlamydiales bacterium]
MKQLSLFICSFLFVAALTAQTRRSITVKAGQDVAQTFSPNGFYRLPQFDHAVLYTKNKIQPSQTVFNYNIYSATIQFLGENGDTMDLINPSYFDSIVVAGHVFIYKEGFLEQAAAVQPVKLLKKTVIKLEPQSIGAYGTTNSTSAIDKITTYAIGNNVYNFRANQDILVRETIDWFLLDGNGKLLRANKSNLLSLLPPDGKQKAEAFLKQHKTDFNKEQQLKELFAFLQ